MWPSLAIGLGLMVFGVGYEIVWRAKQRRPRPAIPPDVIKWGVPVNDPDSAIGGGWFVEIDGQRVAELTEPRCQVDTPHWLSFVVVPLTDDTTVREQLFTLEFWHSGKASFRSRKFGVLSSGVLVSGVPPCPNTHRIIARGFNVQLDPGPSLFERLLRLFKRGAHGA